MYIQVVDANLVNNPIWSLFYLVSVLHARAHTRACIQTITHTHTHTHKHTHTRTKTHTNTHTHTFILICFILWYVWTLQSH